MIFIDCLNRAYRDCVRIIKKKTDCVHHPTSTSPGVPVTKPLSFFVRVFVNLLNLVRCKMHRHQFNVRCYQIPLNSN